jgi:hypothetical protein
MLCQDDKALFTPPMCIPILLDWAHQLMYVHDQLLIDISSSGMLVGAALENFLPHNKKNSSKFHVCKKKMKENKRE